MGAELRFILCSKARKRESGRKESKYGSASMRVRDVVDRDDVGMIRPRGSLCFDQKRSLPVGIGDLLRGKSFQSDDTVRSGVSLGKL
jgi:hypothetical protein